MDVTAAAAIGASPGDDAVDATAALGASFGDDAATAGDYNLDHRRGAFKTLLLPWGRLFLTML